MDGGGSYECWSGDRASLTLNFTTRTAGTYVDVEGKTGSFAVDPNNSRVTFWGGTLDGGIPAGMWAEYHEPKGMPTLSIRKAGSEIAFCEKARQQAFLARKRR